MNPRRPIAWAALALLLATPAPLPAQSERRLEEMQAEIGRLRAEMQQLSRRERGVLGELETLGAELRLRAAEEEAVRRRLTEVEAAIADRVIELEKLETDQRDRRRYLAFRLREIYKAGPDEALWRLVGGDEATRYLDGLRYATFLGERDRVVLRAYRQNVERLQEERVALEERRRELAAVHDDLERRTRELEAARRRHTRMLNALQDDRSKRGAAISELEEASRELSGLVDSLDTSGSGGGTAAAGSLDMRKFRGLLDWPAEGRVSAGFGSRIHPRFKTRVPHPGLDIDAGFGAPIRSVFDGRVVFASWMRGYGLTAIVDHGHGVLTVYAHASVLMVEPGDRLRRNQRIGAVGDTGSLKGAYLYFEIRVDGEPVDPAGWLRRR